MVMRLVELGTLTLDTTARALLGSDLALVDDDVTIEHLLAHRSGIGDYLDEDEESDIADYAMPVPVQDLASAESYLQVLDGFPQKFPPDTAFSYCNGGYVVLAILAERATGTPYHELVDQLVCVPAGLGSTSFLRSDELPGDAAMGYLGPADAPRTNIFHLPVRGVGDGGIYTTTADLSALWTAFFDGRIVSPASGAAMIRPRSHVPEDDIRYGLGFWLHATADSVSLVGMDAGVSFRSAHSPSTKITHTVISNWADGAWPISRRLGELLHI
jgi:CubicO group peptidase (beta-lactamase class C family)